MGNSVVRSGKKRAECETRGNKLESVVLWGKGIYAAGSYNSYRTTREVLRVNHQTSWYIYQEAVAGIQYVQFNC